MFSFFRMMVRKSLNSVVNDTHASPLALNFKRCALLVDELEAK